MPNQYQHLVVLAVFFFVVVPLFKGLWAFITKKRPAAADLMIPDTARQSSIEDAKNPDDPVLNLWREKRNGFLAVEAAGDTLRYYDMTEVPRSIRTAILDGLHLSSANTNTHVKGQDDKWTVATKPLSEIINNHFKLNVLYRPVWASALAGLKWGALLGIGAKLVDTSIGLFQIEPGAGLCFLAAVALCFVPKIGVVGMVVASFVIGQFYSGNFFLMGLTSALTGAILGSLPGMAVGGLVGLARRGSQALAPDALPEGGGVFLKGVLLPALGGIALLLFYVFVFNQWLISMLS